MDAEAQREDNGRKIETRVSTWEDMPGGLTKYGRMEKMAVTQGQPPSQDILPDVIYIPGMTRVWQPMMKIMCIGPN